MASNIKLYAEPFCNFALERLTETTHKATMHCSCAPPFQLLQSFAFSALFLAKIIALKMQIFQIFALKTPPFSRETCSLDPTFGNLQHIPTKKSWVPPPMSTCNQMLHFCKINGEGGGSCLECPTPLNLPLSGAQIFILLYSWLCKYMFMYFGAKFSISTAYNITYYHIV